MDLWRLCFDDKEEFIQFYFSRKYKETWTVVLQEDKATRGALQIVPYPMTCFDTEISTGYISGACTHPSFRNQGVMKMILQKSFKRMFSKKILISTLIPQDLWLYDYYSKMGFATTFSFNWEHYSIQPQESGFQFPEPDVQEAYDYFNEQMYKRPLCIQHPFDDFRVILDDLHMSGGKLIIMRDVSNNLTGMAFAVPKQDCVHIYDLLANSELEKRLLLNQTAYEFGTNHIMCKVPGYDGSALPGGMARIINVMQVLEKYVSANPDVHSLLEIHDPDIPENNGFFWLTNGTCFKLENPKKKPNQVVDIQTLTRTLFGQYAFASLMLDN